MDPQVQSKQIQQLQAVRSSLSTLMERAQQQKPQEFRPVMNAQVQQNLNNLIRSERDNMIRMSQSLRPSKVPQSVGASEQFLGVD